jgi:hypothetical protein
MKIGAAGGMAASFQKEAIARTRKCTGKPSFSFIFNKKSKKLFWRNPKTTIFAIPKTDTLSAKTF